VLILINNTQKYKLGEMEYQEVQSMKKLSIISCAAVIMFLLAATAFSQLPYQAEISKSSKGACKADIETFCKDIKPGGGRLKACIKSNSDRISQECKDHMAMEQ
jgi:Cysteine rich repeat